jgi:hypothetical protein
MVHKINRQLNPENKDSRSWKQDHSSSYRPIGEEEEINVLRNGINMK